MLLSKAIEILEALYRGGMSPSDPNPKDAFKLGVEAMKRIDRQRHNTIPIHQPPLPGETMF